MDLSSRVRSLSDMRQYKDELKCIGRGLEEARDAGNILLLNFWKIQRAKAKAKHESRKSTFSPELDETVKIEGKRFDYMVWDDVVQRPRLTLAKQDPLIRSSSSRPC
jgi:hypothetical protein